MNDTQTNLICIGVDVAKDEVVVARDGETRVRSIKNAAAALRGWLDTLPPQSLIGVESTGNYHERLATLAHRAGMTVFVLNPRDVSHYASALGRRAKTDRVDALLLARYVAREHTGLHAWQPPTPQQRRLDSLLKRRATLVKAKGAMRQSLSCLGVLKAETGAALGALDKLLAAIDREIERTLAVHPAGDHAARLRSIPGIGLLSGAALVNLFGRLPDARADAVVAFVGLDPRPHDSWRKRGTRRLSKRGSGEPRRLLFNAVMSAAKTRAWKPYYDRERAKGLASTAALVCLARRLLRLAFTLFQSGARFDPGKLQIAWQEP